MLTFDHWLIYKNSKALWHLWETQHSSEVYLGPTFNIGLKPICTQIWWTQLNAECRGFFPSFSVCIVISVRCSWVQAMRSVFTGDITYIPVVCLLLHRMHKKTGVHGKLQSTQNETAFYTNFWYSMFALWINSICKVHAESAICRRSCYPNTPSTWQLLSN